MNAFFASAITQAEALRGNYARFAVLLAKVSIKISRLNWKDVSMSSMQETINVFLRMAKAYSAGHYRFIPWKTMAIVLGSLLYFLNPFDIVPDVVPVLGLGDDFAVLMWVYNSVAGEVDRFLAWEKMQPDAA
ncbi:MAG: DUF1232 domain-containing protein [Cyclobacteriaceae bacterium]|nr:DUF1232 domain-containing protein [Cyclobacteriaceae bacterium]